MSNDDDWMDRTTKRLLGLAEKTEFPLVIVFSIAGLIGGSYLGFTGGGLGGAILGAPVGFGVGIFVGWAIKSVLGLFAEGFGCLLLLFGVGLFFALVALLWGVGR